MRLQIPDIPRSPNGPRGTIRMHWAARSKYNHKWIDLVRSCIDNSHKPQTRRCKVTISQMRKRLLDKSNLFASVKPIEDALTYWKIIKDDSTEWIDLDCRQVVGKEKWTIIEVEEL
jgi:hypothetical protein